MSDQDQDEQMAALFGPAAKFSDHKRGESIKFMLRGREVEGEITWITEAGDSPTGKYHAPVTYICAVEDELMPVYVYQTDVLEQ